MNKNIICAFWSPFHGQTATTSNLAVIGTMIGLEYELSTLLMHTKFNKSNLENAFLSKKNDLKETLFDEAGIDSLERLAATKQLTENNFKDYTKILIKDRLELVSGTNKKSKDMYNRIINTIDYILSAGKKVFDLILVDASSGSENEITNRVLEFADVVIINLNQNIEVLESFFTGNDYNLELKNKNVVYLLGNYEKESKYTVKYIKNLFNINNEIFVIPRNTALMDAHNDNNLIDFILANINADKYKDDENGYFISKLKEVSGHIVNYVNPLPEHIKNQIVKTTLKTLFESLLKRSENYERSQERIQY